MDRLSNGHGRLNGHGDATPESGERRAPPLLRRSRAPRPVAERPVVERPVAERVVAEHVVAERVVAERVVAGAPAPAEPPRPSPPPFNAFESEPVVNSPGPAGTLDGFDASGRLSGWAWAPGARSAPLTVRILESDALLAEAVAGLARPDVAEAGYGDGVCGFTATMPHALFDGARRTLVLQMVDDLAQTVASLHREIVFPDLVKPPAREVALTRRQPPAKAGTEIYVPGQLVPGRRDPAADVFYTTGWGEPDDRLAHVVGPDAVIEMIMRRPDEAYTLELDLEVEASRGIQRLELFFNYFRIGGFELAPGATTVTARLPAELFILRRATVTLHCPTAPGVPGASRLGLRSWCIR